jgi:selenide, water dikinase
VTGAIDPARVLTNAGAQPGDILLLTKPIGTGVIGTAIKFERITPQRAAAAIESMRTLNRAAAEALMGLPIRVVHACTDITGFGLIGHACEMARASRVTIAIDASRVPVFDGVLAMATANRSGGMASNQEHFGAAVRMSAEVDAARQALLFDPQTSGGLLVAVAADAAARVEAALAAAGVLAARVGKAEAPIASVQIDVRP